MAFYSAVVISIRLGCVPVPPAQAPAVQVVALAVQQSPLQVALPSPEVQLAALALMIQKLLAPLSTAASANGKTALSNILLINSIALSPF